MRIGLDLDGVCYQWSATAEYMIRERIVARGAIPPAELWKTPQYWNWIEDFAPAEDWEWLWTEGVQNGLFRYGHVVKGAIEGVNEITRLGETTVITARPKGAVHDTMAWLELMFNKAPLAGVVIQTEKGEKKSQVVPTPDVYVDDAEHNYDDMLANTEAYVIQFVQDWNRNYRPKPEYSRRLIQARDWGEIVGAVKWVKAQLEGA